MPAPSNVYALRNFGFDRYASEVYCDGMRAGANELAQPGSDPYQVRIDSDPIEGYSVYLQFGRYGATTAELIFD